MTISERVKELDRLYKDWDRKFSEWCNARGKDMPAALRARDEAWERYEKFRDSKEGIEA